MIKTEYLPYEKRSYPLNRSMYGVITPSEERYLKPGGMTNNYDRIAASSNDDVASKRSTSDWQPIQQSRAPRNLPSVVESGPQPPPTNVYHKDGIYQCPYVSCFARRVADKEVTVMTDCWERVMVWKRVKKPCKVRIPQYEPSCRMISSNLRPLNPPRKHLRFTTYSAPKVYDRNNDGILDADERAHARAAGKLVVENVDYSRPQPQYATQPRNRVPTQRRKVETTYSAPISYDTNKDGILDATERSRAGTDGQLKLENRKILPVLSAPPTRRVTYSAPARYDINHDGILDKTERHFARNQGHLLVE